MTKRAMKLNKSEKKILEKLKATPDSAIGVDYCDKRLFRAAVSLVKKGLAVEFSKDFGHSPFTCLLRVKLKTGGVK